MNLPYRQIWVVDFEFGADPGERPTPRCVVAREYRTGRIERGWLDDGAPDVPPYPTGPDVLFVAYYASAELGCHLELDWPMPERILDLYAEFRNHTSGLTVPCGRGLPGALTYFGLDSMNIVEKAEMRALALRGGPYTDSERLALTDYCQTDVDALTRLLPAMLPYIDVPRALLRGRYMGAVARMERTGTPIDTETRARLVENWNRIKGRLVARVNELCPVFVPTGLTLNPDSTFGAAILDTAKAWDSDPYALADAVEMLYTEERDSTVAAREARKAARERTGLTINRIVKWEASGKDYSSFPGLDGTARSLAGEFPELQIGPGYNSDDGYDDTNYAGSVWDILREPEESVKPRTHPEILNRAAELVHSSPNGGADLARPMTFSTARFIDYLTREQIAWPMSETGQPALDDDTFREMARLHPKKIGPIREVRYTLSQLRLNDLAVGADGRNRCLLSPFGGRTGRNQPSNTRFIFGPSTWLRALVQPNPGWAIAYCDFSQQELAIAAYLSGDGEMMDAYRSGDFYLTFGKLAGAISADGTKLSHGTEREQFKVVSLGVLYGLSEFGIARKLNVPPCRGRELLEMHKRTFPTFWRWSDGMEMRAMLTGKLQTCFGWTYHVPPGLDAKGKPAANPRSIRNFPMQAHGAEMLRLACCLTTERGIRVCAPVHDALLVEAPIDDIADVVSRTQAAMVEASELVLPGFPLRVDAKVVRHPDRYLDPRGEGMWNMVSELLEEAEGCERRRSLVPG